jgi:hypothetical protein
MVSFHNPAVLALDFCEYQWVFCSCLSSKIPRCPLLSGPLEAQPHVGWSLHVRSHCARRAPLALLFCAMDTHSRESSMPDGSSSRLLATSGMSSKDVYAADGRYGYVFNVDGLFWPRADVLVSWVDLLSYAPRHAHGRGHGTRYSQHDDEPNPLSGVSGVLHLPLYMHILNF